MGSKPKESMPDEDPNDKTSGETSGEHAKRKRDWPGEVDRRLDDLERRLRALEAAKQNDPAGSTLEK